MHDVRYNVCSIFYLDPTVSSLVESPENVKQFLVKNMSFPPNLADSVLNARVNFSKVRSNFWRAKFS